MLMVIFFRSNLLLSAHKYHYKLKLMFFYSHEMHVSFKLQIYIERVKAVKLCSGIYKSYISTYINVGVHKPKKYLDYKHNEFHLCNGRWLSYKCSRNFSTKS